MFSFQKINPEAKEAQMFSSVPYSLNAHTEETVCPF